MTMMVMMITMMMSSISFDSDQSKQRRKRSEQEKLKVIPIRLLKEILKNDIKNEQILPLITNLDNSNRYDLYAYHFHLLKEFTNKNTKSRNHHRHHHHDNDIHQNHDDVSSIGSGGVNSICSTGSGNKKERKISNLFFTAARDYTNPTKRHQRGSNSSIDKQKRFLNDNSISSFDSVRSRLSLGNTIRYFHRSNSTGGLSNMIISKFNNNNNTNDSKNKNA